MPKVSKELKPAALKSLGVGMHRVGGVPGLHLRVSESGAKNWVLRVVVPKNERSSNGKERRLSGKRREMGLGALHSIGLAEARDRARAARRLIDSGVDPIEQRDKARDTLTSTPAFEWCAKQAIGKKRLELRNAKSIQQWENTLATFAYPVIGRMPVDKVDLPHIIKILQPIWTTKIETATRLRQRLEFVLAWAKASRYRGGDNPAAWKGNLETVLAKPGKIKKVKHHRALSIDALPEFMIDLRLRDGLAARALEFAILTAARSGEVRKATWSEFDLKAKLWSVPAEHMKSNRPHRVPLCARAVKLLESLDRYAGTEFVFPAPQGGMLSDMTLTAVCRRMGVDAVPHGFRSTFRVWASERTAYAGEVKEAALAHVNPNKVEEAYQRSDLFGLRTKMMNDWQRFIETPPATGNVVAIKGAKK